MRKVPVRHLIAWAIVRPLVIVFIFFKFGYRFRLAKNLPDNYIVLANHNTDYDPLFVAASFPKQMYFVGSEHISRWKVAYDLLRYFFQPILRYKGTSAASTVMEMLRSLRAGANVCMFPEGARSWNGVTAPILPSTGKVVKSAKCGLVTFKIEGGYFVSPNWSEGGTRRGRVSGKVVRVYTPEELSGMSVDEINSVINRDLHEDAYVRQLEAPAAYRGKQIAYRMENMLSHCPNCREMDTLTSCKNTVACSKCGHSFQYTQLGMLEGTKQKTVKELFQWQKEQVLHDSAEGRQYKADNVRIYTVENHVQTLAAQGTLSLDKQHLTCQDLDIPLDKITDMAMHGRHAIVLSAGDTYYEILPDHKDCALKFHLLYQAYKFGAIVNYN